MLARGASPGLAVVLGIAMALAPLVVVPSPAIANPVTKARPDGCAPPPDLPRRLATRSKYDQSIASKSVIDVAAEHDRAEELAPVTSAIRRTAALARAGNPSEPTATGCAIRTLRHWAATAALTEMATSDANLSRDRFTSEIAGMVLSLQASGESLAGEPEIREWLATLARQTMAYYDWKAGPNARRNNHRYVAGVAVADIGDILGDRTMQTWAEASFALGACQIDKDGFLPLELARAERAYEYHLYAYQALNRLAHQAASRGKGALACAARLDWLHQLVARGPQSAEDFARRTGLVQRSPSRTHLSAAKTAPPVTRDRSTTSDVKSM